jgi:hypothetical protein
VFVFVCVCGWSVSFGGGRHLYLVGGKHDMQGEAVWKAEGDYSHPSPLLLCFWCSHGGCCGGSGVGYHWAPLRTIHIALQRLSCIFFLFFPRLFLRVCLVVGAIVCQIELNVR